MPIEQLTQIPPGTVPPSAPAVPKKYFLGGAGFPLFSFFIFGLVFLAVNIYMKPVAPDITNEKIKSIFETFARYFGFVFAFISLVGMYVLYGLKKLFWAGKIYWLNPLIAMAAIFPWWFFARQMMYFEKRYTDIGRGAITYFGQPLDMAVKLFIALSFAWLMIAIILAIKNRDKKIPVLPSPAPVSEASNNPNQP